MIFYGIRQINQNKKEWEKVMNMLEYDSSQQAKDACAFLQEREVESAFFGQEGKWGMFFLSQSLMSILIAPKLRLFSLNV